MATHGDNMKQETTNRYPSKRSLHPLHGDDNGLNNWSKDKGPAKEVTADKATTDAQQNGQWTEKHYNK